MRKLILIVVVLVSCSTPQPRHNYNHHYKHKGFDYERHNKYQQKMVKKMKRVNKRQGKTYFIINVPINNINNDQQKK